MWDSLQNILPKVANKLQMKRALDAIEICREYRSLAPRFLPGEPLKNTTPRSYKDRTLTVSVNSSAWAQEIHMRGHLIKEAINRKFGENTVNKIKILVSGGEQPSQNA